MTGSGLRVDDPSVEVLGNSSDSIWSFVWKWPMTGEESLETCGGVYLTARENVMNVMISNLECFSVACDCCCCCPEQIGLTCRKHGETDK